MYTAIHGLLQLKEDMILYQLHVSTLSLVSTTFATIFSLPSGLGNATEGQSDLHPVVIPQVRAKAFDHLLEFIIGRYDVRYSISRHELTFSFG